MMKKNFFKQKMALFFGYNGKGFHGLQIQRDTDETVERALEVALYECGFIQSQEYQDDKKKSRWTRASRTDKGVHAAANAIGCTLNIDFDKLDGWNEEDTAGGKLAMQKFMDRSK